MIEKLNLKDLPGWVILTFAAVITFLFASLIEAKNELRRSEVEHKAELAACRSDYQKRVDSDLAEWKANYIALKKEQEEKMKELKKYKR